MFRVGLISGVVLLIAVIVSCVRKKRRAARNQPVAANDVFVSSTGPSGTTGKKENLEAIIRINFMQRCTTRMCWNTGTAYIQLVFQVIHGVKVSINYMFYFPLLCYLYITTTPQFSPIWIIQSDHGRERECGFLEGTSSIWLSCLFSYVPIYWVVSIPISNFLTHSWLAGNCIEAYGSHLLMRKDASHSTGHTGLISGTVPSLISSLNDTYSDVCMLITVVHVTSGY